MTSFLQELESGIGSVNKVAAQAHRGQTERPIANGMPPDLAEEFARDDAKRRNLESELRQAWVKFTEYHGLQAGLEALGNEVEGHGNLDAATIIYGAAEMLR